MGIKGNKHIEKITAEIESTGPLRICSGKGNMIDCILVDMETKKPFIPASGIAGAFKAYLKAEYGGVFDGLLGDDKNDSKIYFFDSIGDTIETEIRPGIKQDPKYGGVEFRNGESGQYFKYEYLTKGCNFLLEFKLFAGDLEELEEEECCIKTCLDALNKNFIMLGSRKTSGAGRFRVNSVKSCVYALNTSEGLADYLKGVEKLEDMSTKPVKREGGAAQYAEFVLKGTIDQTLIVKSGDETGEKNLNAENMRDGNGDYIIPGSTIKGICRSYSGKIINTINGNPALIADMFGPESEDSDGVKKIGRVYARDILFGEKEAKESLYNRIKIDRFTGGTTRGGKFTEKTIKGNVVIRLHYKKSNNEKKDRPACALLLLTLREIAAGRLPVGSGNNVGYGRIRGETLRFDDGKNVIDIPFIDGKPKLEGENESDINKLVSSLTERQEEDNNESK